MTPDTLLRWYRRLVAQKYDGTGRRGPNKPSRTADVVELVLRMAHENSGWGYSRIRGALSNLGHDIGRNTIKRILLEAGIDPAPERSKRTSWSAFLRAHWGAIAAMDFFTVEAITLAGLVRYNSSKHADPSRRARFPDASPSAGPKPRPIATARCRGRVGVAMGGFRSEPVASALPSSSIMEVQA